MIVDLGDGRTELGVLRGVHGGGNEAVVVVLHLHLDRHGHGHLHGHGAVGHHGVLALGGDVGSSVHVEALLESLDLGHACHVRGPHGCGRGRGPRVAGGGSGLRDDLVHGGYAREGHLLLHDSLVLLLEHVLLLLRGHRRRVRHEHGLLLKLGLRWGLGCGTLGQEAPGLLLEAVVGEDLLVHLPRRLLLELRDAFLEVLVQLPELPDLAPQVRDGADCRYQDRGLVCLRAALARLLQQRSQLPKPAMRRRERHVTHKGTNTNETPAPPCDDADADQTGFCRIR